MVRFCRGGLAVVVGCGAGCACGCGVVGFSVVLVVSLIFTEQTQLSQASHPAFAFVLIWFLLVASNEFFCQIIVDSRYFRRLSGPKPNSSPHG